MNQDDLLQRKTPRLASYDPNGSKFEKEIVFNSSIRSVGFSEISQ
jgi:hypothetical protein